MTRQEHNAHWKANRTAAEPVYCNTIGYGELSQYDARCPACWLGHSHAWEQHDASIAAIESMRARDKERMAAA